MKVIMANHTGRNDDKSIRFWNYDSTTKRYWLADDSVYAIVDTKYGYQMVKVLGVANVRRDGFQDDGKVITFITADDLPDNTDEQVDNQQ